MIDVKFLCWYSILMLYIITNILKKLFIFICSFWNFNRDYKHFFRHILCLKMEFKLIWIKSLQYYKISASIFDGRQILKFLGHLVRWRFCYRGQKSECILQDEFVRGLFFPATGDAREKSPAQETREAEDDGGMSNLTLIY